MSAADSKYAYYSLRPLFTRQAYNGAVSIQYYVSGTGLSGSETVAYTGDMEALARTFLGAMDSIIAPFAGNSIMPPPALSRIYAAKGILANAITTGMVNIQDGDVNAELMDAAIKAVRRGLKRSMARGYDASAVVIDTTTGVAKLHYPGDQPTDIPVAVRSCPLPAILYDQQVVTTWPEAETAVQAAQCQYSLSWFYEGLPEDTVWLRLVPSPANFGAVAADSALLQQLVQFIHAYPALAADVPVNYVPSDAAKPVVVAAYGAFAAMAEAIAAAWLEYVSPSLPSLLTGQGLAYGLQQQYEGGYLSSVALNIQGAVTADTAIPALFVKNINGKYEQLAMTQVSDTQYNYAYAGSSSSDGCSMLAEFACTDIYSPQPLFEAVVTRNQAEDVNMDLVYQAGSGYSQPLQVSIEQYERFNINTPGATVAEAMQAFFVALLQQFGGVPKVEVSVVYTYPVSGIWTSLPVTLMPPTIYSDELAAGIVQMTTEWSSTTEPPAGGHFAMKVTMYNAIDQRVLVLQEVVF